jgi:hypothetical protein
MKKITAEQVKKDLTLRTAYTLAALSELFELMRKHERRIVKLERKLREKS